MSQLNFIRDNFSLPTWLLVGACLQSLLVLLLPTRVALLPAVILFAVRFISGALIARGYIRNSYMDGVYMGRYMVPMLEEDEPTLGKASGKEMAVFIVGATSNQYVFHPIHVMSHFKPPRSSKG